MQLSTVTVGGVVPAEAGAGAGAGADTDAAAPAIDGAAPAVEGRPRALLVEDDLDQRVLLSRLLERVGYAVLAVASAAEALTVGSTCLVPDPTARSEAGTVPAAGPAVPARVILLDLRLPDLDGRELLQRLRSRHPGCPIVICSVLDAQDYPPADGVLPKPVTSAALRRVLDDLHTRGAAPEPTRP